MVGCSQVDPEFVSPQGQNIFLCSKSSTPAWAHQAGVDTGDYFAGLKWPGRDRTTHLHLVPSLAMSGALPLLPQDTFTFVRLTLTCHLRLGLSNYGSAFLIYPKSCRISRRTHLLLSVAILPDSGPWPPTTWSHSAELLWTSDNFDAETSTWQQTTLTQETYIHAPGGIWTTVPASKRPQTHALDCATSRIGTYLSFLDQLPERY